MRSETRGQKSEISRRMLATVLTVLTAVTASAQVWTNAPPPVTPPGWTNGTVPPPPWYATVMHTGVVAGVYSNLQFSGRGTQELARIIAALAGSATNGVNSAVSVETTSNHVALASNALTVYFKTNYTGNGGTGADTNSVGVIATNAVNQSTNIAARLASNVWAAADSTTNYVRRTGGEFSAASWLFLDSDLNSYVGVSAADEVVVGAGGAITVFDSDSIDFGATLVGNGSGLTGLNYSSITGPFSRAKGIVGINNVATDGGHAAINNMETRLDLRSTNNNFAVLGLYQTATNLNVNWPPGLDIYNYGSTVTGQVPAGIRSGKLFLGIHTAEGVWGPQLYGQWDGTTNTSFSLITAFADAFGTPAERTRVTASGLVVSGTVTASTGFIGDGSGLTNLPTSGGGSGVATNLIGIGAGSTNLFVVTSSNAVLTAGTNSYRITFRP